MIKTKNLIDYIDLVNSIKALISNNVIYRDFVLERFKCYPCSIQVDFYKKRELLPSTAAMKVLKDEYNHNPSNDFVMKMYDVKLNHKYVSVRVAQINEGVMVAFVGGVLNNTHESNDNLKHDCENYYEGFMILKVYYLPEYSELADNITRQLTMKRLTRITKKCISMICLNQTSNFFIMSIEVRKPIINNFKLNYGEEFVNKHEIIKKALTEKDSKGLLILYGPPGTGKTNYLRYLIHEIAEKTFMYLTGELIAAIGEPNGLFDFMLTHKNSILIIEDAEIIMKSRSKDDSTNQTTSILLNLSDGLLSDCLYQPIIVTFNCNLESIDPAFLRKGRLIAQHEFGRLSVDGAQELSNDLGFSTVIKEPMTLAEIYNQPKDT